MLALLVSAVIAQAPSGVDTKVDDAHTSASTHGDWRIVPLLSLSSGDFTIERRIYGDLFMTAGAGVSTTHTRNERAEALAVSSQLELGPRFKMFTAGPLDLSLHAIASLQQSYASVGVNNDAASYGAGGALAMSADVWFTEALALRAFTRLLAVDVGFEGDAQAIAAQAFGSPSLGVVVAF